MILQGKVALVTGGTTGLAEQQRSHSVLPEQKLCSQADAMLKVKKPPN